ncbi:hypothetical protein N7454_010740 [Penicillium verhagenii]|nr:hypothetical protein N7454_010740 [Penicillium verhagenii]
MKKTQRSVGLLDEWINSQIEHITQDPNVGFVEVLYQTCSVVLVHLWRSHFRFMLDGARLNVMKRDVANMRLWEGNFSANHLDIILGQSSRLKTNVVENLKGIGDILVNYILESDKTIGFLQVESIARRDLVKDLRDLLQKATIFLSAEDKSSLSSDEDASDDSSDDSLSITDREFNCYGRLHSYVVCLMDLVPAIERQVLSLQQRVTHQIPSQDEVFLMSQSAQPFARRISDRFANAPTFLVERLAAVNWERFVRIRNRVEDEKAGDTRITIEPHSVFHDSGVGTSVFTRSQYAATAASHKSFLSIADEQGQGRPRVPQLPHEPGLPFKCEYCHKLIFMRNRISWKIHVFADLQSYICTHEKCKDALKTFASRDAWAGHEIDEHLSELEWCCYSCKFTTSTQEGFVKHLAMVHGIGLFDHPLKAIIEEAEVTVLKPDFGNQRCPLCFQSGWENTREYATHVGRHLEEISLACLPMNQDCESDVDFDVETSSGVTKKSLPVVGSTTHKDDNLVASTAVSGYDNAGDLKTQNHSQDSNGLSESQSSDFRRDSRFTGMRELMGIARLRPYPHDLPHIPVSAPSVDGTKTGNDKMKAFKCRLCETYFTHLGSLQRHIEDQHFPSFNIRCPDLGCQEICHRRDKARDHCRTKHGLTPTNSQLKAYTLALPFPPSCGLCSRAVDSWKSFYKCFKNHCIASDANQDDGTSSEAENADSGGAG